MSAKSFWVDQAARRRYEEMREQPKELQPLRRRVLVPTPEQLAAGVRTVDATPEQIPANAARVAALLDARDQPYQFTYSLAENLLNGELVHTVCLRWIGRGYACWCNGRFDGARIDFRRLGYRELVEMARGEVT